MSDNESCSGETALKTAGEFVKYLVALATGAIVFTASFLSKDMTLTNEAKWWMLAAWIALGISIVAGLATMAACPVMLKEKNYDLNDLYFKWPIRIQQVTFFFGMFFLGIALALTMFAP